MKVAITGHTSGVGKALSEVFPDFIGFSRTNGFDLNNPSFRHRMPSQIEDCQVFVNNAPIGWNQISLLYEVWDKWKDKENIIVNIGSDSADYNLNRARPYNIQKRALEDAALQMQHSQSLCKVITIKPSYIDTPRVADIDSQKIDPKEIAVFIKDIIEQRHSTFWIPTITIYPR